MLSASRNIAEIKHMNASLHTSDFLPPEFGHRGNWRQSEE